MDMQYYGSFMKLQYTCVHVHVYSTLYSNTYIGLLLNICSTLCGYKEIVIYSFFQLVVRFMRIYTRSRAVVVG